MNNNWHIKIEDCTEAQKERLKRVYGDLPININTYLGLHNGIVIGVFGPDGMGELITPDEAFERLGLNHYAVNQKLSKQIVEAEQKIKELEQQLAAKSELQEIDWSQAPEGAIKVSQMFNEFYWLNSEGFWYDGMCDLWKKSYYPEKHSIIATRPKPKYTPEQIEAVKDFDAWVSRRHKLSGEFNWWLKEVNNET